MTMQRVVGYLGGLVHTPSAMAVPEIAEGGLRRELDLKEKYRTAIAHYRKLMSDMVEEHGHPDAWDSKVS